MNEYVTGAVIRSFREKKKMTQSELAEKLCVSDKTISKWETGKGYPDISLLESIARELGVSITELLSGNTVNNQNVSSNMFKSRFYVCPICSNVIHSMGEAVIQCHGITLLPYEAEECDEKHFINIEKVEDEYYVSINHEMNKEHYISFIGALSNDGIQFVKLYPESNAESRFKIRGVRKIICYCNRDGLYIRNIK